MYDLRAIYDEYIACLNDRDWGRLSKYVRDDVVHNGRSLGVSGYVGDGLNRWPAAHVDDVARLYRLALEKGRAGARYHAVAEEGIAVRRIAEVVGRGLDVPTVSVSSDEAARHFGWLAAFAGMDLLASGARTQSELGWHPTGPGLLADLERMDYSRTPA